MTLGSADRQNVPVIMASGKIDYSAIPNAAGLALHPSTDGKIPARTVDAFHLDDVGFIKVDTQGSDLRVLRGAEARSGAAAQSSFSNTSGISPVRMAANGKSFRRFLAASATM